MAEIMEEEIEYGTIAVVPQGEWSDSKQYEVANLVTMDGSSYVAHTRPPVGTLPTHKDYWQVSAQGTSKATADSLGTVQPDGETITVDADGAISVKTATQTAPGIVKGGAGVKVSADGEMDVDTTFTQATQLANLIAGEAIAQVLGKVSKSIATTMHLDANALLKNMLSSIDTNDANKIPTSAYIHTLVNRIGMGETLSVGDNLTTAVNQLNSEMASDLVKKRQPSNTNPNTIMETDIRSINGWDSTIQDIIPAVLRNQWLLCVTTSPYASNSEALCQILIGTNIAAYASRNMDINGNWTTWKISDTIRSKDYTTSSLALSADSYNVLADLSALAGKEIIGVAVKDIQVPSTGNQTFYANVYISNNELRAIVSISQYYAFKVSVLYR